MSKRQAHEVLERSRLAASLLTHDQYVFEETHVFVARNQRF
jgi:hypothetical protein